MSDETLLDKVLKEIKASEARGEEINSEDAPFSWKVDFADNTWRLLGVKDGRSYYLVEVPKAELGPVT